MGLQRENSPQQTNKNHETCKYPQSLKISKFKIKDVYCTISLESMRKLAANCKGKSDLSFPTEKGQGNVKT